MARLRTRSGHPLAGPLSSEAPPVSRRIITLAGASLVLVGCSGSGEADLGKPGGGAGATGAGGAGGDGAGGAGNAAGSGGTATGGAGNGTGGGTETGGAAGSGGQMDASDGGTFPDDARIEAGNPEGMVDGATAPCDGKPTSPNDLGPFYRAGAPTRSVIAEKSDPGEWLILTGWVKNTKCDPLPNALLDAWQSDGVDKMAAYDNSSPAFHFRGKFNADAGGAYKLETVLPGHYLNGNAYRVRHIHFIVSASGGKRLTTQVEFEGDPAEAEDPISEPSLRVPLTKIDGVWRATFNIVLAPGPVVRAPEPRRREPSQLTRRSFFGGRRWS
jgi:catechol 1,2-dioxygenase